MTAKGDCGLVNPVDAEACQVARMLRHEVGDLLQSVYSTVAILAERLPDNLTSEHRLLNDLKGRAELCRLELDAVVELFAPAPRALDWAGIDPVSLVGTALIQVRRRFPSLPIRFHGSDLPAIAGEARRLPGAFGFLLIAVCQGARNDLSIDLSHTADSVRCRVERDGFALGPEAAWLQRPFATTQQALLGLALALFKRTVEPHGGISITGRSPEGVSLELSFPVKDS